MTKSNVPKSQPWQRKGRDSWFLTLNGKQISLGKDKAAAFAEYHRLMAEHVQNKPIPISADVPCVNLLAAFLLWTSENRSPSTYKTYHYYIANFMEWLPAPLKVSQLTCDHFERWFKAKYPNSNDNTKAIAVRAVKRAFSWAVKAKKLKVSPIATLEGTNGTAREVYLEPADFDRFYAAITNQQLKDIVFFMWRTGCRPIEAYSLEARHVENGCCVFEVIESKGKQKRRIVPLDPETRKMVERLAKANTKGPLFRNSRGGAYTSRSLNQGCKRYAKKAGIKEFFPYYFRHAFATRALLQGISPLEVAQVMGHCDTTMLTKVYAQLQLKSEHLQNIMAKANEPIKPLSLD